MEESSPNTTSPAASPELKALRYYNDAVIALDVLYAASFTSEGAREELHAEALRLMERAAQWHDMKSLNE